MFIFDDALVAVRPERREDENVLVHEGKRRGKTDLKAFRHVDGTAEGRYLLEIGLSGRTVGILDRRFDQDVPLAAEELLGRLFRVILVTGCAQKRQGACGSQKHGFIRFHIL